MDFQISVAFKQLLLGNDPILIFVNLLKLLLEQLDVVFLDTLMDNEGPNQFPELELIVEFHEVFIENLIRQRVTHLIFHPLVVQDLLSRNSGSEIYIQHLLNQI